MALTIPPLQAAAILLPILCIIDIFSVRAYRKIWDRPNLRIMLPGALVGIMLGTLTAGLLGSTTIRLILGIICVVFSLNHWIGRRAQEGAKPSAFKGGFLERCCGLHQFYRSCGRPRG